jgi:hypothetical protein
VPLGCGGSDGADSTPITTGTTTSTTSDGGSGGTGGANAGGNGGTGGANTGGNGGTGGANTGGNGGANTGGTGGANTGGTGGSVPTCAAPTPDACGQDCVDLTSDLAHCGDCDTACAVGENATVACTTGQCILTCAADHADVDSDPATGCEVDLTSDPKHCGAVDAACSAGPCTAKVCTCDDSTTNGDETDFNCGGSCAPCADTKLCKVDADCASEICEEEPDLKRHCHPAFSFGPPGSTALPNFKATTSAIAASVNSIDDAHVDVVVGGECDSDACVGAFLGNGAGALPTAKLPSALTSTPIALTMADLNQDGWLDAISVGGDAVHVALGNGKGNFGPIKTTSITGSTLISVAAGHLSGWNGDVVVADDKGFLHVLYGKGDGTFDAPKTIAIAGASAVSIGQVDAIGDDILVTSKSAGTVTLLLGAPASDLAITTTFQLGADRKPSFIQVADINHDNRLDVVTANDDKTASVLLGDGKGGFDVKHWSTGVVPSGLAVGKFTMSWEKKELDLAVTDKNDASFVVLINRGEVSSTFKSAAVVPLPNKATSIVATDLNNDTWPDLVITTTQVSDGVLVLMTGHEV